MEDFLNNQWTITIGGGIILTLTVKILEWMFSFFYNSHKITKANEEITLFLKQLFINRVSKSPDIINSAINYYARKFKVDASKLYEDIDFIENVLIEIHQESYISKEEKEEITQILLELKSDSQRKSHSLEDNVRGEMKSTDRLAFSVIFLGTVVLITVLFTLINMDEIDFMNYYNTEDGFVLTLTLFTTVILTSASMILTRVIKTNKESSKLDKEIERFSKEIEERIDNIKLKIK